MADVEAGTAGAGQLRPRGMRDPDVLDAAHGSMFDHAPSFSLRHRAVRALWQVTWLLLARWTPPFRLFNRWRILLLRLFGANVSFSARIAASARVWYPANLSIGSRAVVGPGATLYAMDRISIGRQAVVSQRAHLCCGSHDLDDPNFQLTHRPITIGDKAWVAAEAFVGPGVTLGEGAVLGARGVALRDLAAWTVYSGNPASVRRQRRSF